MTCRVAGCDGLSDVLHLRRHVFLLFWDRCKTGVARRRTLVDSRRHHLAMKLDGHVELLGGHNPTSKVCMLLLTLSATTALLFDGSYVQYSQHCEFALRGVYWIIVCPSSPASQATDETPDLGPRQLSASCRRSISTRGNPSCVR